MTLFYPDISGFQAGLDLRGALAVSVKATEGTGWSNSDWGRTVSNASGHGCYHTGYHFLLGGNGAGQAAHAHSVAGKTPLMIDVEAEGTSHPGVPDVAAFIDAYRKAGGVTHLVYLPHWYWQSIGSPALTALKDRGMLLVSSAYSTYTDRDTGIGWAGYGGMTPSVWQYTDRLHFNGRDVDFNAYRGTHPGDQSTAAVHATLAEFKSLCETGKMPAKPEPLPTTPGKPAARSASGRESLRHAAHREGTTVQRALWLMARDPDRSEKFGAVQRAYVAGGDWDAIMPTGMVYWVG